MSSYAAVPHETLIVSRSSRHAQIIIAEVDMFDYSEGEPPQEYLTVLRALEVGCSSSILKPAALSASHSRSRTSMFCASW